MSGCLNPSGDCSFWAHNCRHVKIFDNIQHALWFINGKRTLAVPKKDFLWEIKNEENFPFSDERKNMRAFKLVALYETKVVPLQIHTQVEEIVTLTKKETVQYILYNNKTNSF